MTTTTIAALIAAIASTIGTIVTLHTANQSRRIKLVQDQLRLFLQLSENRINRLRTYASGVERLRGQLQILLRDLRRTDPLQPKASDHFDRLANFRKAFDHFWLQWADAKGDIPDPFVHRLRVARHELSPLLAQAELRLESMHDHSGNPQRALELRDQAAAVLLVMLARLDALFALIGTLRVRVIESAILSRPTASGQLFVEDDIEVPHTAKGETDGTSASLSKT